MKIKTFEFNPVSEHTYVVYDHTGEAMIVDAGCYFEEEKQLLKQFILSNKLTIKHLVNTHLHFDHIFGCDFVTQEFKVGLEASAEDQYLLEGLPTQLQMFGFPPLEKIPTIAKYLKEGDTIEFGEQQFIVIQVPGHSPGSLVFYNAKANCLFSGDVLFYRSVGRTDLPNGNHEQLIEGIKTKLLTLPPETLVYPGHGLPTNIGTEKLHNAFLKS